MSTSGMHIDDALNDSLDMMAQGMTIEECLERYPALSDELAPLLRLAMETQGAAETMAPSPEARRTGLGRITDEWAAMQARRSRRGPWRLLRRSWALAAVAALVLAFGGWTTTAAAQDSVPGDTLYPVKQTHERVLLLVVFTHGGKADLHARLAEARAVEATKLAAQGSDPVAVDQVTRKMQEHMSECVSLMGGELPAYAFSDTGMVRVVGPGGREYSLSRNTSVSGEVSIGGRKYVVTRDASEFSVGGRSYWAERETRRLRPPRGEWSSRRAAMKEQFYQHFLQFQQGRGELSTEFRSPRHARIEAAFQRSEQLMLEALLMMQALEDAHHPPE
ncbi:MAG: DUF5667 domain-containing protein [Chloroflexi bacterium]|nr:DUF5667 domain-containing protein [Chloroflexota bacterium]